MPTKKAVKKTVRKAVKKTVKKTVKKAPKRVAKKVAKKTIKKTTKKSPKKATKRGQKKSLVYADQNASFWVTDGQILNSLIALRDALHQMDKQVYQHHAAGWQNDFAQWVAVVLDDHACAVELRDARTPRSAKVVVVRHLKFYIVK